MAYDGTEILIEALKAAVTRLDDARVSTDALQQALRAAELRELTLKDQTIALGALCEDLQEQVGTLRGSMDAAHLRIAEAEADRDRYRRAAEPSRHDGYSSQVPR